MYNTPNGAKITYPIKHLDYEQAVNNTWHYYKDILNIFESQEDYVNAMMEKANKTVIIDRRGKLINYLKQFENDVNLSLTFFGELASTYNCTVNQNILNQTPACFSRFFPNQPPTNEQYRGGSNFFPQENNPPSENNFTEEEDNSSDDNENNDNNSDYTTTVDSP